ncbi:MAG: DUF4055 domain-containing protein [Pseudomonadota bacterium]
MALRVQDQSPAVLAMAAAWPIVNALLGGTMAMRAAGASLLPKWPNEEQKSYEARLATATLFPAFPRTVGVMVGKPTSKQLTLGDDVPPKVAELMDDVDRQGSSLHAFVIQLLFEVMGPGIAGVLVDHPPAVGIVTVADERKAALRPYAVLIRHDQVLGWKSETVDGIERLTQLRIAEAREVDDGEYGTKAIRRVRVLRRGSYEVWEEAADKSAYIRVDEGKTTVQDIPYVPFYGKKKGFMVGAPPLLDVAYLNVKHWQSQSDQDTIMHVARVPILALMGIEDDKEITVGSGSAIKLPQGGDAKYVEHTGKAIEAGAASLEALEQQMIQAGAELLVMKPGPQKTATQASGDAEANKSDLQRIVESTEDGLDRVLQLFGDWIGEKQAGHVSLFKDFGVGNLSDASAQLVLDMRNSGLISKKTALLEQQRRGVLSPDIVPEDEIEDADADGPPLGTMTDPANDPGGTGGGNGQ